MSRYLSPRKFMCPPAEAAVWPDLPAVPRDSLPRWTAPLLPADTPWSLVAPSFTGNGGGSAPRGTMPPSLGRRGLPDRPAAVVILFIQPAAANAPARIVLLRRSTRLRSH